MFAVVLNNLTEFVALGATGFAAFSLGRWSKRFF